MRAWGNTGQGSLPTRSLGDVVVLIRQRSVGCIQQLLLVLRLLHGVDDNFRRLQCHLLYKVQVGVSAEHYIIGKGPGTQKQRPYCAPEVTCMGIAQLQADSGNTLFHADIHTQGCIAELNSVGPI